MWLFILMANKLSQLKIIKIIYIFEFSSYVW